MEHYERLMGDVHVAVVARAVWERLPKAKRVGKYADAQFAVADVDTLCGFLAESLIDETERARATEFLGSAPALTEQVVSLLQTEDGKWPHISCNAGLGAMQLRFCWACKEGALGIGDGTMMRHKRVEKHVASAPHKAAVLRVKAVEHQAQLCARAFKKHERAKERGEDISHKEHQKRLRVGKPILKMSKDTCPGKHKELVRAHDARQLEEVLAGNLQPLPAAAAEQAPSVDPLCEPTGVQEPKRKAEAKAVAPPPAACELQIDAFTAQARLIEPIGIDRMRSCAEATGGRYTPEKNAAIIVYEKDGDKIEATVTVNTGGLAVCMAAPTPEAAQGSIDAVLARIGPKQEGSFRVTMLAGGACLGITVDLEGLAIVLYVNYEGEIDVGLHYKPTETTAVHVFGNGKVRVSAPTFPGAKAAYEEVRRVAFELRNGL